MNRHTVFVAGKRFVLLSDEKSEYVQKLAQEVNDSISKIAEENPSLESRACALLCALDYADDMYQEQKKNSRFVEEAKVVMTQSDAHAKKIVDLKSQLEAKDKEIANLKAKINELQSKQHKNASKPASQNQPKYTAPVNTVAKKETPKPAPNPMDNLPKPEDIINKGYTPIRQISLFDYEKY